MNVFFYSVLPGMILAFLNDRVDVCGQPSQHLMMNLQVTARKNSVKDGFPFLHHTAQDSVNPDGLTVSIQGDAFHCQQLIPKQILFKC